VTISRGFWAAATLAFFLSAVSWMNRSIVALLNTHLFHVDRMDYRGWWLYVGVRLLLALLLAWMIWRFPKQQGKGNASVKEQFFDPLMGIRAMACLMVLMGHFFLIGFPFIREGVPNVVQMLLLSSPWAGVWIFFALSGYLMGKGFTRNRYTLNEAGYRSFMRNRLLRIAPVYCIGLFLISLYRYTDIFQLKNGWMMAEMFLFDYRGDLPINPIGALWSVSTEMQFYLLAPMLILILTHLHKWTGRVFALMPILFLCAGTVLRMYIKARIPVQMYSYGYAPLIPNLDVFLAGMSINLLPRMDFRKWFGPALFVSSLGCYAVICYVTFYMSRFHMGIEDYWARMPIFVVLIALGLIYLAEARGKMAMRGPLLIALQAIGTLTYCLYVFHPEVFYVNGALLPQPHSLGVSLLHFPLVIIETAAVAAFFYFAVEKPFDIKKRVNGSALTDAP
jgi:peptidoglycan/LPS O-acetylase OafA/YrhL